MIKFIKGFIKEFRDWDDFMSTVNFYRFNPHSIRFVSRLMCKMGRHDYEALSFNKNTNCVTLECFYCGQEKGSRIRS